MNELDVLTRARADVPEADPAVLADIRAQLLTAPSQVRPFRRRYVVGGAAVAAAAAAAIVIATAGGANTSGEPSATPHHLPQITLAAKYLSAAADHAVLGRDPTPGPGQYLHVTTHSWAISENVFAARVVWLLTEGRGQLFIPADRSGTWYWNDTSAVGHRFLSAADAAYIEQHQPELITPSTTVSSGKDGREDTTIYPSTPLTCGGGCDPAGGWGVPTPEWVAALPRDPSALRASLYDAARAAAADATSHGKADDADSQAFNDIAALLAYGYVPADLRAALYRVATTIPGIRVIDSTANLDGRQGVAIGHLDTLGQSRTDIIFDTAGGEFIGERQVVVSAAWARDHGTVAANGPAVPTTEVPVGTVVASSAVTVDIADAPDLSH